MTVFKKGIIVNSPLLTTKKAKEVIEVACGFDLVRPVKEDYQGLSYGQEVVNKLFDEQLNNFNNLMIEVAKMISCMKREDHYLKGVLNMARKKPAPKKTTIQLSAELGIEANTLIQLISRGKISAPKKYGKQGYQWNMTDQRRARTALNR